MPTRFHRGILSNYPVKHYNYIKIDQHCNHYSLTCLCFKASRLLFQASTKFEDFKNSSFEFYLRPETYKLFMLSLLLLKLEFSDLRICQVLLCPLHVLLIFNARRTLRERATHHYRRRVRKVARVVVLHRRVDHWCLLREG